MIVIVEMSAEAMARGSRRRSTCQQLEQGILHFHVRSYHQAWCSQGLFSASHEDILGSLDGRGVLGRSPPLAAFNRAVRSHIESKSNGAINKVSAYITTFFDDLNQCVTHFTQAAHSNGHLIIYQGLGN
jgi:hypothetical protein